MATCFIAYVPKPTKEKHIIKSAIESEFLIQKANGDDGIMVEESLTEIYKSSNNGDKDEDDTYFPTVQELIARRGVSRGYAPNAIDKLALDDDNCSTNPDKSMLGPYLGNSQDRLIVVGEDEQVDLSDFHTNSTKSTAGCLESRQTSLDTTISSSSNPQSSRADCKGSRAAKLRKNNTFVTEIAHSKRVSGSLKRKTRSIWGEGPGDLLESQDSSTDSDSDSNSNSDSEFDDGPAQKMRKTDNAQHRRKGHFTSRFQKAQTVQDELPAIGDPQLDCTEDCQDPFNGQDPCDEAIKLLAATSDSELERNDSMDDRPKEDNDVISSPQSREDNKSHSPHMAPAPPAMAPQKLITAIDGQSATLPRSSSMIPELNDPGMPQPVAEVTDGKQEWEISDIIGKEVVDGEVHYLVEWSATLVPKCELGKAKDLVDKFEARLRAHCRQKGGKRRGRLLPRKAGKQAIAGTRATGET